MNPLWEGSGAGENFVGLVEQLVCMLEKQQQYAVSVGLVFYDTHLRNDYKGHERDRL